MEIWKDVPGFEGIYQVTRDGRVRSLDRTTLYKDKHLRFVSGREMKPFMDRHGYKVVTLKKNRYKKHWFVHRIVGITYIPNPDNLPQINHKDEVKTNNNVENLEWCTNYYNEVYGTSIERSVKNRDTKAVGRKIALARTFGFVDQLDLNDNIIKTWVSARTAGRSLGKHGSNISKCCNGQQKTAYGYKWVFSQSKSIENDYKNW